MAAFQVTTEVIFCDRRSLSFASET